MGTCGFSPPPLPILLVRGWYSGCLWACTVSGSSTRVTAGPSPPILTLLSPLARADRVGRARQDDQAVEHAGVALVSNLLQPYPDPVVAAPARRSCRARATRRSSCGTRWASASTRSASPTGTPSGSPACASRPSSTTRSSSPPAGTARSRRAPAPAASAMPGRTWALRSRAPACGQVCPCALCGPPARALWARAAPWGGLGLPRRATVCPHAHLRKYKS